MASTKKKTTESTFERNFGIMMSLMRFSLFHPHLEKGFKWKLKLFFLYTSYMIVILIESNSVLYHDIPKKRLFEVFYNSAMCSFTTWMIFHSLIYLKHQNSLAYLIDKLKQDYLKAETLPSHEREIVLACGRYVRKFVILWVTLCFVFAGFIVFKPLFLMPYHYYKDGFFKPVHIHPTITLPDFLEPVKDEFVPYIMIYLVTICHWVNLVLSAIIASFVQVLCFTHGCGQLEIVRLRSIGIFPDEDYDPQIASSKLRKIVQGFQNVFEFIFHIEMLCSLLIEVNLKATVISAAIGFFQIMQSIRAGTLNIEFFVLLTSHLSMFMYVCHLGERLMAGGENVREAIYMNRWEKYSDKRFVKTILIFLTRTMKPVTVKTLFNRRVGHTLITEMFNQAYAIFNLINVFNF